MYMNVLYLHVENPVRVGFHGYNTANVSLEADGIVFRKEGAGSWIAVPEGKQRAAVIEVRAIRTDGKELIGKYLMRIKRVPDPYVDIMRYSVAGPILRNKTLAGAECTLVKSDYQVKHFELSIITPGRQVIRIEAEGDRFSPRQMDLLNRELITGQSMLELTAWVKVDSGPLRKVRRLHQF